MNSFRDIWNDVIEKLSEELTPVAMNTWFSDCEPVEFTDRRIVLQTSTEFKRDIITGRFSETIKSILSDLFCCEFEVVVLIPEEYDEFKKSGSTEDSTLPEALDYTFDRFIVGDSNKTAYAAAMAAAENPGGFYNPLFIYGNSGLGKTHLLLAVGHAIKEKNPYAKISYAKGDDFTNQFVNSLRYNQNEEFRQKYRNVDLLLVDDIQFISNKVKVQDEFFNTFNSLYEAGHQIVITSDRPPMEMSLLQDRLRTRFEGGLLVDVQPPDLETRIAIILNKSMRRGLVLAEEVVDYIASTLTADVRQIEGVINRLCVYSDLENTPIDITTVKRAIKDVMRTGVYIPTPEIIISETARYFNLSESDICGQSRAQGITLARQISMYLIRTLIPTMPLETIGTKFGGRNHSTVLNSTRKIESLLNDSEISSIVRDITSNINSH